MKKQIPKMKFRVVSEQESIAIQKLLFMVGFSWGGFGKNIRETNRPYLYACRNTVTYGEEYDLYEAHQNKETTLEELKSIVGEWLYGDILGCQVSIPSGKAFVKGVEVWDGGEVVLILETCFEIFPTCISDSIWFFTNDYNDDTLLFEDFLKFIRSENVSEERKYK